MIALKCPSCSADLTLDDNREFGFCQYCGTKIQLAERVVHSGTVQLDGIRTAQQKLEAAKTLIELGEYDMAKRGLTELTETYPQIGEGWLYMAKLKYSGVMEKPNPYSPNSSLFGRNYGSIDFIDPIGLKKMVTTSPEQAADHVIKGIIASREMTNALKLLGADHPAYKQVLSEFTTIAQKDCARTRQQISIFENNPMMLAKATYSSYISFFICKNQLMYGNDGTFYSVSFVNGRIEKELVMGYRTAKHITEYVLYADDQEILTDKQHYHFIYGNDNARSYTLIQYEEMLKSRRKNKQCIRCGGPTGLFGICKDKWCTSLFR